jgi:hypothetical protein
MYLAQNEGSKVMKIDGQQKDAAHVMRRREQFELFQFEGRSKIRPASLQRVLTVPCAKGR